MTESDAFTRRTLLEKAGAAGAAVAGGTLLSAAPAAARRPRRKRRTPIDHLVISCQENRSFDHYFGYAPQVQARRLGPPPGYTQPDAAGVGHAPFELTALRSVDPPHGWNDVHAQYNGGKMDGFFRNAALRMPEAPHATRHERAGHRARRRVVGRHRRGRGHRRRAVRRRCPPPRRGAGALPGAQRRVVPRRRVDRARAVVHRRAPRRGGRRAARGPCCSPSIRCGAVAAQDSLTGSVPAAPEELHEPETLAALRRLRDRVDPDGRFGAMSGSRSRVRAWPSHRRTRRPAS